MAFIQIIEYRTSDHESMRKAEEEWLAATEGKRTARRLITGQDRNDPSRFMEIVFFDSYESAMENSNLPETAAAAEQFMSLSDGAVFHDLEVIGDMEG
ncbi:MAG TPA: hypothetical protein VF244_09780 [Acidimicrobiales bacterium]